MSIRIGNSSDPIENEECGKLRSGGAVRCDHIGSFVGVLIEGPVGFDFNLRELGAFDTFIPDIS